MVRLFLVIFILLCITVPGQSDPRISALDTEPGLEKRITLSLRAASIKELLAHVQGETGVRLRAAREIQEDKASIWVEERPARDVLRALAHCFNLRWSEREVSDITYLRLWMDRDSLDDLRMRQYEDYTAITHQFDAELQAAAEFIRSGVQYEAPPYDKDLYPNRDEYDRLVRHQRATRSPEFAAMILQCLELSDSQRRDLFEGKDVEVSGTAIAQKAAEKFPEATSFRYWVDQSLGGYLLYCSSYALLATALFDDSRYRKIVQSANDKLLQDPKLDRELPVPKPERESKPAPDIPAPPAQMAPEESEAMARARELLDILQSGVPRPGEGSAATPATMSDGLLPIAEAAEIPAVAQYVSEYAGAEALLGGGAVQPQAGVGGKVAQRLADICNRHLFTVERDGDFLLAKCMLWHRLRGRELPEETIKRWQRQITGLPLPTFSVAVEMGGTTWERVRGIIANGRYWFGTPSLQIIAQDEHALKLYASLTSKQRGMLNQGMTIPVFTLKPEQQHLFMQVHERNARPTYKDAQGLNWPAHAALSLKDQGVAAGIVFAAAGMRSLGYEEVISLAEAEAMVTASDLTPEELREIRERLRQQIETELSDKAKAFARRMADAHPEIPPKTIEIYAIRLLAFGTTIGDSDGGSYLPHAVKVTW